MVPDMIFCMFLHDGARNFTQVIVLNVCTVYTGDSHDSLVPDINCINPTNTVNHYAHI